MRVCDLRDRISIVLVTFPPSEGFCSVTKSLSPLSPLSSCCPASPDLSALGPRFRSFLQLNKNKEGGHSQAKLGSRALFCAVPFPRLHSAAQMTQVMGSEPPSKWTAALSQQSGFGK